MNYAIVYSSRTGNTKLLAEAIRDALPAADCLYFGPPDAAALRAQRIYAGFWTDKGTCDSRTAAFLKQLTTQELFLFGTAGFGENQDYFSKVLKRAEKNMPKTVRLVGSFMCQGKMPMTVRERYETMQRSPIPIPNLRRMIANFDKALSHPDGTDLEHLRKEIAAAENQRRHP